MSGSLCGYLAREVWLGFGYGLEGCLPKIFDLAKIGLANGQPGSDTKSVTTGFPGNKFLEKTVMLISSRITVS